MYYYDYLFLFLCFLFIHSSLDGLLGCFHLLAIGHNASVNTSTQICLGLSAFNSFGYNPEGELPDHFVILFLIFWGSTVLFSIGLDRLTFSPSVHRGSNSFASSPTPVIFCLFFFFLFIMAVRESQLLRAALFLVKVFSQENPDLWATQISVLGNLSSVPTVIPQLESH